MAGEISIYGVFFPLIQLQGIVALVFFFLDAKSDGSDRRVSVGMAPGSV